MLEVETKYRVGDWEPVRRVLESWGAALDDTRRDTDHYFNAPDRDFARTDEALRLRRIGTANYLTYKGPKVDTATKTRTELDLPIGPGPEAATAAVRLLTFLGYRPVAVVSKTRQVYTVVRDGFPVEVCLDDVGTVGKYVEIEVKATEPQFAAARAAVLAAAADLGLTDPEHRSYLQLLLAQPPGVPGSGPTPTPPPRG